jgi:arylsulfatase A-like enzyme
LPPLNYEKKFVKEDYKGKLRALRKSGRDLEVRVTSNAFYDLSKNDVNYLRDLYDAEINYTDNKFGEILNYLKRNELYKDTIIIVTSDHGEEFWENGGTGHGFSLREHQLKVPLIIKSPTFSSSGKKIQELVGLIDIAPTILDILGIPIPNEFQGISLLPLIEQGISEKRSFMAESSHLGNQKAFISKGYSFLFNQFPPIGENIFSERSLYIWRNIMQFSKNELYNIVKDPFEKQNIILKESKVSNELKTMLLQDIKNNFTISNNSAPVERFEPDKETLEKLKALGYVE